MLPEAEPDGDPDPPGDWQDPQQVAESLRAAYESRLALLLKEELEFLVPLLTAYPKCYWIWSHRLWTLHQSSLLLRGSKATAFWTKELALVGMMLTRDARNFHGWMYRRRVVAHIENSALVPGENTGAMVRDEFRYTIWMLTGAGGMKNYSAWHQRRMLIPRLLKEEGRDDQEKMDFLEDELELLERAIRTDPDDQSLWFYHRWLVLARDDSAIAPKMPPSLRAEMLGQQIDMLRELLDEHPECKYILKALVVYVQALQGLRREPPDGDDDHGHDHGGGGVDGVSEAAEGREMLGWLERLEAIDPMRRGRYKDLGALLARSCPRGPGEHSNADSSLSERNMRNAAEPCPEWWIVCATQKSISHSVVMPGASP